MATAAAEEDEEVQGLVLSEELAVHLVQHAGTDTPKVTHKGTAAPTERIHHVPIPELTRSKTRRPAPPPPPSDHLFGTTSGLDLRLVRLVGLVRLVRSFRLRRLLGLRRLSSRPTQVNLSNNGITQISPSALHVLGTGVLKINLSHNLFGMPAHGGGSATAEDSHAALSVFTAEALPLLQELHLKVRSVGRRPPQPCRL